jgi:hypothetical protein
MRIVLNNFNGGEFGKQLLCRMDLERYSSSLEIEENFTALASGTADKRTGSRFIAACKYDDKNTRLIPFEFNVEQAYAIEAGHEYFRFFANNAQIMDGAVPYEVASPYAHETIFKLRYRGIGDVIFLSHPDYPPARLVRYDHDNWVWEVGPIEGGPFQDENKEDITVSASGVTGDIVLTASADIFKDGMENGLFQILHPREDCSISHMFDADGASPDTMQLKGQWKVETTGSWNGTLVLERSFDNGANWQDLRSWTANQDRNIDDEGFEDEDNVLFRLKMTNWSNPQAQTLECKTTLSVNDFWVKAIVKITVVNSATSADATVIDDLAKTDATRDWSFGAWNEYNGYPSSLCFYQDRLCFAATAKQPQSVWMSVTGDYYNFKASTLADASMNYTIKSTNAIQWMLPKRHIVIGTRVNEGMLKPTNEDEPMTSGNRKFDDETNSGSADIEAIYVNDAVLFAQRGGEKIRELAFNFEADGYRAPDMSIYSPDILDSGCLEMCYQQLPESILWCVRNDGQIAGFTYERSQNVTAWFRYVTDGAYRSAAVIADESTDELMVIVDREIEGQTKKYIESFANRKFATQADCFFVDCGITYDGAAKTEIDGLDHLEGKKVSILADGAEVSKKIVNNGKITLPSPAAKVQVGLPLVSKLKPLPLEFSSPEGMTLGLKKKIKKVTLKLLESHGGGIGFKEDNISVIEYMKTSDQLDTAPELYTGEKSVNMNSGTKTSIAPMIVHDTPLPFSVQAMIIEMEI